MDFKAQIKGLPELTAAMASFPGIAAPILKSALSQSQGELAKNTTKSTVPWRTGNLTQTFRAELQDLMLRWFPTAEYAPYVQFGTKPHVILPKNKLALYWKGAAHPVARVNHPGTKPNDFMGRILESSQPGIDAIFTTALQIITTKIAAAAPNV